MGARDEDGATVTSRHPMDCYITPPCASVAIGRWLAPRVRGPLLDPFAGPGLILTHAVQSMHDYHELYAFDLDASWGPELHTRVAPMRTRLGRDSFVMDWCPLGERPHVLTNPPFGRTQTAVEMAMDHARTHGRYACVLMRTDWWQHPGRGHLAPDHFLALQWRPVFGLNKQGKFSTDYAGYVWCVWEPEPSGLCRMAWLARPDDVTREMVAEHRRLARLAYDMAQGA